MKRLLMFVAAFVLGMCLFAAPAFASQTTYTEGYFYYTVADESVTITGYFGREAEVTVPSSIAGYPVNSIAEGAFAGSSATTVHLPDTVSYVADGAMGDAKVVFADGTAAGGEAAPQGGASGAQGAASGSAAGGSGAQGTAAGAADAQGSAAGAQGGAAASSGEASATQGEAAQGEAGQSGAAAGEAATSGEAAAGEDAPGDVAVDDSFDEDGVMSITSATGEADTLLADESAASEAAEAEGKAGLPLALIIAGVVVGLVLVAAIIYLTTRKPADEPKPATTRPKHFAE